MLTAKADFDLNSGAEVLKLIGEKEFTFSSFKNSTPYRNKLPTKIMVDAYEFFYSYQKGYIAFWQQDETGKWFVKSFKLSEDANRPFISLQGLLKH